MTGCLDCGRPTRRRRCHECQLDDRDYSGRCVKCGDPVVAVDICDDCSDLLATAGGDAR